MVKYGACALSVPEQSSIFLACCGTLSYHKLDASFCVIIMNMFLFYNANFSLVRKPWSSSTWASFCRNECECLISGRCFPTPGCGSRCTFFSLPAFWDRLALYHLHDLRPLHRLKKVVLSASKDSLWPIISLRFKSVGDLSNVQLERLVTPR